MLNLAPDELPVYRLTGPDDESFCCRVSDAITLGYRLYGSPVVTFDGARVIVGQAVLWPTSIAGEKTAPLVDDE